MIQRSKRGAAKVSIVWAIVLFMAFAVAAVAFFLASGEATAQREAYEAAERKWRAAEAEKAVEVTKINEFSKAVGFSDEATGEKIQVSAVQAALKSLQEVFPEIDPSTKTVEQALPIVISAFQREKENAATLQRQLTQVRGEKTAAETQLAQMGDTSRTEVAALQSRLADAEEAAAQQKGDLERQRAEAIQGMQDRDQQVRALRAEIEELKRAHGNEAAAMRTRMAEQERKLNPIVRAPESLDATVLAVSPELRLGWIDVGAKQRLARGMRFRVVSGKPGARRIKAWAEVTRVEPERAEIAFVDQTDAFDPPVPGDVVYNPIYDPRGERNAVLVGRFSGALNETEIKALLADMRIHVTQTLDKSTDLLIAGGDLFVNPDDGQPLETPLPPSELPIYKDAVAAGVQVVPVRDLYQYFTF